MCCNRMLIHAGCPGESALKSSVQTIRISFSSVVTQILSATGFSKMELNLDKEGFLREMADWSEEAAQSLAMNEGIDLTADHWEIISLVRDYYRQYQVSPPTRVLVKVVRDRLGDTKGNSIHLMQLFSGKPVKLVSKIAGLPKPSNCE
jgi:tRNA 2-thiouridine synthesizing protein E|tara:strand:+ start:642 stop:1085 length:444 start_codon:yes stop_codon:yes gene_type:complete